MNIIRIYKQTHSYVLRSTYTRDAYIVGVLSVKRHNNWAKCDKSTIFSVQVPNGIRIRAGATPKAKYYGNLEFKMADGSHLGFFGKKIANHIFMGKSQKCSCNMSRNMFLGSRNPFLTSDLRFNPNYAKWWPKNTLLGSKADINRGQRYNLTKCNPKNVYACHSEQGALIWMKFFNMQFQIDLTNDIKTFPM